MLACVIHNKRSVTIDLKSDQGSNSHPGLARALQRSEVRRAWVLIGVMGVLSLIATTRFLLGGAVMTAPMYLGRLSITILAVLYALGMVALVRRAERDSRLLPAWLWAASTLFETMMPTAALLSTMLISEIPATQADAAPAVLNYLTLAVISVLRLRPAHCVFGGIATLVQHAGLVTLAMMLTPEADRGTAVTNYAYSALLFVGWMAAAFVSFDLRKHMIAGLRAAETRAELSQLTKELEVANRIQQRLMPTEPLVIEGYEIAGWNRPASQTGGDYYDWMAVDEHQTAIVIGDVTGHGVGPALLMAVCRAYARATLPNGGLHASMTKLNALLAKDMDDGRFITFAAAVLDRRSGEIDLLSAGHGPIVMLHRKSGKTETMESSGMPLGVMDEADFEQPGSVTLQPGDVLMLVTDGFVEAIDPESGKQYGTERLERFIAEHQGDAALGVITKLAAEVDAFTRGSPQADDMTAVMIRRRA